MKQKLTHYLILLAMVIVVNFFLPRWMPGSPVRTIAGEDVGSLTAEERMGILEAYDLDKPLYQQFLLYLRDLFTLNWGNSYSKRQPILSCVQRTDPIRQCMGQHRDHPVYQIHAGSPL